MTNAQIDVKNVSKTFSRNGRGVQAIEGLNFSVQDGQFVSFVGASGCGKSTFLRMLDGLSPTTSGSIEINGVPVERPGRDRAFVFQQDRMLPWRTVLDNVAFGLEVQGTNKKDARAAAMKLLTVVGLARFANSHPGELSGGMRQRANLARAYAVEPKILLMDEPYAALDGQTRELMQAWLMETWEASKRTVLFVTHQIDEAVYLSDRVIVMTARPGRVKADITIDLPRPRTLAMKRTPEFTRYIDQIWSLIEEEVKESMNLEMQQGAS